MRGRAEAVAYIEGLTKPLLISVSTAAELYSGVREGAERTALDGFIAVFEWTPVDRQIAVKGGLYRRDYRKSHGVGLADALIAATAEAKSATLVTLNKNIFHVSRCHRPIHQNLIAPQPAASIRPLCC